MGIVSKKETYYAYNPSCIRLRKTPEDSSWLEAYERRSDSIFRYYSLENEVAFLTEIKTVPYERKRYYVAENVKRFLGEFVGKIPYTIISYEIGSNGFEFAGFPVMSSYQKAAELGSEREQAEIDGFAQIESVLIQNIQEDTNTQTVIWISPPKTADYGFVFIFTPEQNGRVKEYVLRYEEKRGDLHTSRELFHRVDPLATPPSDSDSFLRRPLFVHSASQDYLETILDGIGTNSSRIHKSREFEQLIEKNLGNWIDAFSDIVCQIPLYEQDSPYYQAALEQAKKALIVIYQKAEEIMGNVSADSVSFLPQSSQQKDDLFAQMALIHSVRSALPTALQGSCPSIRNVDFSSPFLSNRDMLRALQTDVLSSLIKGETFPCPKCGYPIPSGKGIETCPNPQCGITKAEYAKEIGFVHCD